MENELDYLLDGRYEGVEREKSFLGIMPAFEIPMDIIGLHLLGRLLDDFHLLIADEFLKFNGYSETDYLMVAAPLFITLNFLDEVYGPCQKFFCHQFMNSEEYLGVLEELRSGLTNETKIALLGTVPEKQSDRGIEYPLNELACVKYLSGKGFRTKIGPKKEKVYDKMMEELDFDIKFAYLKPCYALGTKEPEMVVHYSPYSRGSGQRIFFSEMRNENKVRTKLLMGPEEACRYFCRLGSIAGIVLWRRTSIFWLGRNRVLAWNKTKKEDSKSCF